MIWFLKGERHSGSKRKRDKLLMIMTCLLLYVKEIKDILMGGHRHTLQAQSQHTEFYQSKT